MHEKMEIEERRKQKKIDDKEDLTNEIIYYGLRQSYDQVDSALEKIPTECEKIKALKVQLHFRQRVLEHTSPDKTVYNITIVENNKRRAFSAAELCVHCSP